MITQPNLIPGAPAEPDPKEWIQERSKDPTLEKLSKSMDFLKDAGLWKAALSYWIKLEIVTGVNWDEKTQKNKIDFLENSWLQSNTLKKSKITKEELRKSLYDQAACSYWYHKQWEHRADSLYLQKKNTLDRASCRLLRISDKNFANELYHRIKAEETSFEEAARQYGEGPERFQGGLIPMQPLLNMPFGLAPVLERLKIKEVSTPLRLGKIFCLVELLKFSPSKLVCSLVTDFLSGAGTRAGTGHA